MKTIHSFVAFLVLMAILASPLAEAQNRRRWSPQAKGTAIGGAVGGAAGAIINKRNRWVGGLIGGVAGGAAGYAVGKHKDNKNKAAARLAAARAEAERTRQAAAVAEHERAVAVANVTPAHGFGVARPAALTPARAVTSDYTLNAAFLPNPSFGDANTPYASSSYRRKSW